MTPEQHAAILAELDAMDAVKLDVLELEALPQDKPMRSWYA